MPVQSTQFAPGMFLPPTEQAQAQAIQNRRRLAEAMYGQSTQPLSGRQAGQYYVAPSATEALAKVLGAYMGGKGMREADTGTVDLYRQSMQRQSDAARQFVNDLGNAQTPEDMTKAAVNYGEEVGNPQLGVQFAMPYAQYNLAVSQAFPNQGQPSAVPSGSQAQPNPMPQGAPPESVMAGQGAAPSWAQGPQGMPQGQPQGMPQAPGVQMQIPRDIQMLMLSPNPQLKAVGQARYQTWLQMSKPISTRYGVYALNNEGQLQTLGGAMPQGALPITATPSGPIAAPMPGQIQAVSDLSRAQAAGKTVEITRPDGSKVMVPASQIVGTPGQSSPSSIATQGLPMPGNIPGTSIPMPQGQSTLGAQRATAVAKSSDEYLNQMRTDADNAITQTRMLNELQDNLSKMTPGKLAAVKKSIAEWKIAMGFGTDQDRQIAASSEISDKLTGQLVSQALRAMSARPSQMEFQIFLQKFVPNLNLTPQGAEGVIQFMRQQNNLAAQKYDSFQEWKAQQPRDTDYRDFDVYWNRKNALAPLGSPSSYPNPQQSHLQDPLGIRGVNR